MGSTRMGTALRHRGAGAPPPWPWGWHSRQLLALACLETLFADEPKQAATTGVAAKGQHVFLLQAHPYLWELNILPLE